MDDVALPSRRGALLPSLVAALGILVFVTVTTLIVTAAGQMAYLPRVGPDTLFADFWRTAITYTGFAAACFLSFWLIAPVVSRLSLPSVILRILVAAALAFLATFPIQFLLLSGVYTDVQLDQTGGLYDLVDISSGQPHLVAMAIANALQIAISRLPEIALAAVALWWWLRRTPAPDSV